MPPIIPRPSIETDPEDLIVFISPGNKPDVRLLVFGQEFHVHSHILKEHSNYFRRFLDSPDKQGMPAAGSLFQYEYVTVVDNDGIWRLESAAKAAPVWNEHMHCSSPSKWELVGFNHLLCATYNRPYKINIVRELNVLTRLADFYCALPIVSATLTNALLGSHLFKVAKGTSYAEKRWTDQIAFEVIQLILLAKKLRHPILFRECFIHIVANWKFKQSFSEIDLTDKSIQDLAQTKYFELCEKIMKASQALLSYTSSPSSFSGINPSRKLVALEKCGRLFNQGVKASASAKYFRDVRDIWNNEDSKGHDYEIKHALDVLLVNNLMLDRTGCNAGEGWYTYCFLCTEIADDEMPWDTTAVDW